MDGRRTRKPSSITNNNNKTSQTDRLPNEILSKIIYQVLISKTFRGLTIDATYKINCAMTVNTRFRGLTQRLAFLVLPRIYFLSGGHGVIS